MSLYSEDIVIMLRDDRDRLQRELDEALASLAVEKSLVEGVAVQRDYWAGQIAALRERAETAEDLTSQLEEVIAALRSVKP